MNSVFLNFFPERLPESLQNEPTCLKFSLLVRGHIIPTLYTSGSSCGNNFA